MLLLSYVPVVLESKLVDVRTAGAPPPDHEIFEKWHRLHEAGARDLAALFSELKGFYVKCGQVIATRSDLFPSEYSSELAHFVDSVNPFPFNFVRRLSRMNYSAAFRLEMYLKVSIRSRWAVRL